MASPEDRLSTTVVDADWIDPANRGTFGPEAWEGGPIALNDPTSGLNYQAWHLGWDSGTGDFTVTPETTGSPVVVLNAANVTQCSLAFDQNGHVNISYTVSNGNTYLYWYDTDVTNWVTTLLAAGTVSPVITLDDKRLTQTAVSDILLYYTVQQPDLTYNLYERRQRDRFLSEIFYKADVPPYIKKLGMHAGLRVKLGLSYTPV